MLPKKVDNIKDETVRKTFEHIFEGAQAPAMELDSAPTAAAPILQDGEKGIYGTDYYVRQGGTIYVFAATSTISIS